MSAQLQGCFTGAVPLPFVSFTAAAGDILAAMRTPVYAQKLDPGTRRLVGDRTVVLENDQDWEAHLVEGIWVVQRSDRFYLFYSEPGPKCVSEAASPSFDHLVSAGEERSRHVEAERLGSLEIDEQLNFRCLLDREIRRIGARKDPAGMDPTLIAPINITASVADEAARRSELAKLVDRGYSVANG